MGSKIELPFWEIELPFGPKIELPLDPNNSARTIPHGSYVDFDRVPVYVVPSAMLLLSLYFRGVPMPKGTTKAILIQQVLRARDLGQPLDEDRIHASDASTARFYISFHSITLNRKQRGIRYFLY